MLATATATAYSNIKPTQTVTTGRILSRRTNHVTATATTSAASKISPKHTVVPRNESKLK